MTSKNQARRKRLLPSHKLNIYVLRSSILGFVRFVLFMLWTLVIFAVQGTFIFFNLKIAKTAPKFFHSVYCKILGVKIQIRGLVTRKTPTLFVCNHTSYLDISVLGSLIHSSFVAKKEIESWPVFGLLTKLGRSIFVERKREKAYAQKLEIFERLKSGDNLTLFPEGTSNDGNRIYPFKSSLFGIAHTEGVDLQIQPVSISYVSLDGIPIGRQWRPLFAWYGDMTLFSHLWLMLGLGDTVVRVTFHPPIRGKDLQVSRKELAQKCHDIVAQGHENALYNDEIFSFRPKKRKR
jgi:lyso-ornithine lipid O-acyltransferase